MKYSIAMIAAALMTGTASAQTTENATCPVSGKEVAASAPTASHEGHTIGFCCKGCAGKFAAWDEQRKDGYVLTLASAPTTVTVVAFDGDPYTLGTCPISGKALGEDAVVKTIGEREIRFCCNGCPEKFEASQEASLKKVDEKMIKDQLVYYPLTTCVVSGESLVEEGEDNGINVIYRNRLVRFCCNDCKGEFKEDPDKYIAKIDAAVKKQQEDAYPIKTCPISGGTLGSMGDPVEIVIANRLVKFCCPMCEPKFKKNPTEFMATLDAAWKENGMPWAKQDEKKDAKTRTAGSD